jgi:hypothetical protein
VSCAVNVTVTPQPSITVNVGDFSALSGAAIRAKLEASTATPVALVTGTPVVIASWLVDAYGSRSGELVCTDTTGVRVVRRLHVTHDGTVDFDANAATVSAHGHGSSPDLDPAEPWLDVDLDGAGAAQVVRIIVTADANGPDWTAVFYPDFMRTP